MTPSAHARTTYALAALLLSLALLAIAPQLASAHTISAQYTAPVGEGCAPYAGGRDLQGTYYYRCGTQIRSVTAAGARSSMTVYGDMPGEVAPSPDGNYLYGIGAGSMVTRYRKYGTLWLHEPSFKLGAVPGWSDSQVCGAGLATDGYGYIYLGTGSWCTAGDSRILKFEPGTNADVSVRPRFVTAIGTTHACVGVTVGTTCTTTLAQRLTGRGYFSRVGGVAVSLDGSRVWASDINNSRLQWFDRDPNGSTYYDKGGVWSSADASAAYSMAMDPWGYVYVTWTTSSTIYRLNPDGSNPHVVFSRTTGDGKEHDIGVDARGNLYMRDFQVRVDRNLAVAPLPNGGVLPALPKPDTQDPVLRGVTIVAETQETGVDVAFDATDDVGVTQVRFADASGVPGAWQAFAPKLRVELTAGLGPKIVSVQVRDASGRESGWVSKRVVRIAPPDAADPTLVVDAPARSIESAVVLTLHAADDVAVTHVRKADADGTYGPWMTWSSGTAKMLHTFPAGKGPRAMYVQVRDASYKTSEAIRVAVTIGEAGPIDRDVAPIVAKDRVAPRLVKFTVPAKSCSRTVRLVLSAKDNVGVRYVRVANENGVYGTWKPYTAKLTHVLTKRAGFKRLTVQVADGNGNISKAASRRVTLRSC